MLSLSRSIVLNMYVSLSENDLLLSLSQSIVLNMYVSLSENHLSLSLSLSLSEKRSNVLMMRDYFSEN